MDSLRLADRNDLERLNALIAHSASELSRGYYTAEQIDALVRHVFGVDSQLLDDGTYYAIERGDALLACGGWSGRRTLFGGDQSKAGDDPLLDPRIDPARIRAFFVHPAASRQGLGQRLLAHCEARALAAGFRRAELMATLPGVPFYTAAGYLPIEQVRHRLPDGVEVSFVRMGRTLEERGTP